MVSFTAELTSDTLSTSRKQKLNWRVAARLADLLGMKSSECRQVATYLIKTDDHNDLFRDHASSKNLAVRAMKLFDKQPQTCESNCESVPTEENEYPFDYSLVQKVAELSKDNGYDNVMAALKLYNKLVKGL